MADPTALAVAYEAVETTAQVTIGGAVAVAKSTLPLKASWVPLFPKNDVTIPRSSHSLSVVNGKAYIFGGELEPRKPVDNDMHIITLPASGVGEGDYQVVPARPEVEGGDVPGPRVGHSSVAIGSRVFVFGGRGGVEMKPLDEVGRVWVFDTERKVWGYLDPGKGSPVPEGRSYHAATASEHPLPKGLVGGKKGAEAQPQLERGEQMAREGKGEEDVAGRAEASVELHGTVFVHAGCVAQGRVGDLWAFDVGSSMWRRMPDAPAPARGGAAVTVSRDRLYRFGGFDGEKEIGGQIDYLALAKGTVDDKGGKGEVDVIPKTGEWITERFPDGGKTPGDRSVAGLHAVTTGQGRNYLILLLGEKDPSSKGHEGAGQFWDDVWAYQVRPEGMTGASVKDAVRGLVGAKTGEGQWAKVDIPETSMEEGVQMKGPRARGWFASAAMGEAGENGSVVLWGGIEGGNERLGDGWMINFE
ncbi:hypothetical protein MMC10_008406 [Thelotrema lepadinum]|nr:hypothetical protein [Thelotrema lepadinum]